MIIQRIVFLYGWINCIYFGYYFIKENQTFDDFLSFLGQTYRFDWTKSLGFFGGAFSIIIITLTFIIMGLSLVATLRLIWIWFVKGEIKKEDME